MVRPADEAPDVEVDDEAEESRIGERAPRTPQLTRLGRYRLVREIASGGMASVNLAVTEGLDKLVALKMIHPHLAQQESFVHMFLDEARIASSISHRNVCNTFDFGEAEGRYYIAMDFLAGQSLRDLIFRLRRTPAEAEPKRLAAYIAYILAEACEGLHAAHELRDDKGALLEVVHRDVSPHNLFLTYDGNVSVVDFGIARAANRLQHTATGILKGKFSYMAPEQIRQTTVDRRADIWALGVCLWESLTLERLFVRSSQADTLMSVMMDKVRSPSELRPELPKSLDAIVEKALSRSLEARYATAREMGRDLMQVVRESGVSVGPVELEQWLERLFVRERERSRAVVRQAKKAALEGSWSEAGQALLSRVPTHSGAMPILKNPPSGSQPRIDAMSHPAVPLRSEAEHMGRTSLPGGQGSQRRHMVTAALVGLLAAVGVTWTFDSLGPTPSAPAAVSPAAPPPAPAPAAIAAAAPATTILPPEPVLVEPTAAQPTAQTALPPSRPVASRAPGVGERRPAPSAEVTRAPVAPAAPPPAAESVVANASEGTAPAGSAPPATAPSAAIPPPDAPPAPATIAPTPAVTPASTPVPVAPAAPAPAPTKFTVQRVLTSFESLAVEGSLGKSAVVRMLSRATPLLPPCYEGAAQRAGKNDLSPLDVSLSVDETGAVRSVESGSHPLSGLGRCVGDALKRLRSETKPDIGTVRVRLQISFRPQ